MGWCVLAVVTALVTSQNGAVGGPLTTLFAIIFVLSLTYVIRPIVATVHRHSVQEGDEMSNLLISTVLLLMIVSSLAADIIGIHAFFGSFFFGLVCVPREGEFVHNLVPKVELIVVEIILPLYFASSGMNTNIGSLNTPRWWGVCVAVIALAVVGKFLPGTLAARWATGRPWRFCATLGILMNTRGMVELVVLNIGLTLGILSEELFTIMVIMALLTTFMTSPLLYIMYQRDYKSALESDAHLVIERIIEISDERLSRLCEPDTLRAATGVEEIKGLRIDRGSGGSNNSSNSNSSSNMAHEGRALHTYPFGFAASKKPRRVSDAAGSAALAGTAAAAEPKVVPQVLVLSESFFEAPPKPPASRTLSHAAPPADDNDDILFAVEVTSLGEQRKSAHLLRHSPGHSLEPAAAAAASPATPHTV
jgi:hypothetical protein